MASTVWTRLHRRRGTTSSLAVIAIAVLAALTAPLLPLPDYSVMDPASAGQAPAPQWRSGTLDSVALDHPLAVKVRTAVFGDKQLAGLLGTDAMGRDVAARIVWGGRVSLMVGLVATIVAVLIGVSWGLIAGFTGGRTDAVMMRIVDVLYSVPFLFIVILVIAILRDFGDALSGWGVDRIVILYVCIGAISWLTMARVVRGQVLSLRERDYITAARALGSGGGRVMRRHVLPNLWGIVVVYLTLTVPRVMLFEAFLSFLGLGVEAPGVSWGILASEGLEALTPISSTWWLIVFPGLALVLTLSALNSLGDALRDALDPRLAQARN